MQKLFLEKEKHILKNISLFTPCSLPVIKADYGSKGLLFLEKRCDLRSTFPNHIKQVFTY